MGIIVTDLAPVTSETPVLYSAVVYDNRMAQLVSPEAINSLH